MGLLSFIKEAGEKLFSKGNAQTAMAQAQADPASAEKEPPSALSSSKFVSRALQYFRYPPQFIVRRRGAELGD